MTQAQGGRVARRFLVCGAAAVLAGLLAGLAGVQGAGRAPDDKKPEEQKENSNAVLKRHKDKLTATASTFFEGWPPERVLDDNLETSWFTASQDAAARGTTPWVEIELPADETVKWVTVLGNREPDWLKGFSVLEGTVELFDKDRKQLWKEEKKGVGDAKDFDFRPKDAVKGVRYIRFTSTKDEGDQNGFDDVALAEIKVE